MHSAEGEMGEWKYGTTNSQSRQFKLKFESVLSWDYYYKKCSVHSRQEEGGHHCPNGTVVPPDRRGWLFYITRGPGVVKLHCRIGGVSGIYHCVNQTLYAGLYYTITSKNVVLLETNLKHNDYMTCSAGGLDGIHSSVVRALAAWGAYMGLILSNFSYFPLPHAIAWTGIITQ